MVKAEEEPQSWLDLLQPKWKGKIISGYTGTWFGWNCLLQLTLKTKNGKTYGPYGSMAHATSQMPFSYTAPQGQALLAFYGKTVNVPLADGSRTDIIASLGGRFT